MAKRRMPAALKRYWATHRHPRGRVQPYPRRRRRNPIEFNAKRRRVYLSSHWHHFIKRRPRKNPHYRRNPARGSMMPWLLLGGAAFLFLTPTGKALAARFTGGAGMPVGGYPPGTVRLADGTYRLPSGQVVGTPTGGGNWYAPLVSLVPATTGWIASWIRGLSTTSSATTTPGVPAPGDLTMGASGGTTADILSGGWGAPLPPLEPLGDLTLQGTGTDFWSGIDTSGWWGNIGAPLSLDAGPVPMLDLSLSVGALPDLPALTDPLLGGDVIGFLGDGFARHLHQPSSYR